VSIVRVAVAQLEAPAGLVAARRQAAAAAEAALAAGAGIVVLPELAVPGYTLDEERLAEAEEPLDGPTVTGWSRLARRHRALVAGGFCERAAGRRYNSAVVVGPDGVVLHYRKLHLFAEEKRRFAPGDLGLPVADTPVGRLALCVCYDLRFVETARALALRGAALICVPTAWVRGFDQVAADGKGALHTQGQGVLLQANLDQVFIACASFAGGEFLGHSLVASPFGAAIAGPLAAAGAGQAMADVDLLDVERAQHRAPLVEPRADRRTDVYGVLLEGVAL